MTLRYQNRIDWSLYRYTLVCYVDGWSVEHVMENVIKNGHFKNSWNFITNCEREWGKDWKRLPPEFVLDEINIQSGIALF